MSVREDSRQWEILKRRIARDRPRVRVGIFGAKAAEKANDGHGATVGQIAAAHEFGLGVPRRSWLGDTIVQNEAHIYAGLRKAAQMALDPKAPAGLEVKLLAQTGQYIAGLSRARISAGITPALSARYLKRKLARYPGATTPLIASGQMWGAIGSEVEGSAALVASQKKGARKAARAALARRRQARRVAQAKRRVGRIGKRIAKSAARLTRKSARVAKRIAKVVRRRTRTRRRARG